jgi:hypothetical protein
VRFYSIVDVLFKKQPLTSVVVRCSRVSAPLAPLVASVSPFSRTSSTPHHLSFSQLEAVQIISEVQQQFLAQLKSAHYMQQEGSAAAIITPPLATRRLPMQPVCGFPLTTRLGLEPATSKDREDSAAAIITPPLATRCLGGQHRNQTLEDDMQV